VNIEQVKIDKLIQWQKIVECPECHTERFVRKDSRSVVCKSCSSRKANASALVVIRAKTKHNPCRVCKAKIPARLSYTYCSVACRVADKKTQRDCKCCKATFSIYASALTGKTNASGNFCSRTCYEKWLCQTDRATGRGSQWSKIRNAAIDRHPFCGICGTKKNLQVHHIAPFRITHDNSQDNLIPLCTKHHKIVETLTHDIEATGSPPEDMKFIIGNILSGYSQIQRMRLNARS
jgi:hypothetical protein